MNQKSPRQRREQSKSIILHVYIDNFDLVYLKSPRRRREHFLNIKTKITQDQWIQDAGPFNLGQGENIKKITQDQWIQESGPFNLGQGENLKKITQDQGSKIPGRLT